MFYAWMYAPEANATAETWAEVFEQKQGAVPALYDGVRMPEGLVSVFLLNFIIRFCCVFVVCVCLRAEAGPALYDGVRIGGTSECLSFVFAWCVEHG